MKSASFIDKTEEICKSVCKLQVPQDFNPFPSALIKDSLDVSALPITTMVTNLPLKSGY